MTDLVAELQAHLDTIEGLALEAGRYGSDSWSCPSSAVVDVGSDGLEGLVTVPASPQGHHIVWHDPKSVRRLVRAHRRIIDWCVEVIGDRDLSRYGEFGALKDDPQSMAVTLAVETLRELAVGLGLKEETGG